MYYVYIYIYMFYVYIYIYMCMRSSVPCAHRLTLELLAARLAIRHHGAQDLLLVYLMLAVCLFVRSFVCLSCLFCLSCWFGYLFVCSCCCSVKHNYVCRLCLLYVIVYYYGACVSSMYLMYLYVYSRTTTLTRVGHRSPAKRICRTSDVVTPDRPGDRTITAIVVAINNSSY